MTAPALIDLNWSTSKDLPSWEKNHWQMMSSSRTSTLSEPLHRTPIRALYLLSALIGWWGAYEATNAGQGPFLSLRLRIWRRVTPRWCCSSMLNHLFAIRCMYVLSGATVGRPMINPVTQMYYSGIYTPAELTYIKEFNDCAHGLQLWYKKKLTSSFISRNWADIKRSNPSTLYANTACNINFPPPLNAKRQQAQ